jgi:hypothetical protein
MEEQNAKQTEKMEGSQRKWTREIVTWSNKLLYASKDCQRNGGEPQTNKLK